MMQMPMHSQHMDSQSPRFQSEICQAPFYSDPSMQAPGVAITANPLTLDTSFPPNYDFGMPYNASMPSMPQMDATMAWQAPMNVDYSNMAPSGSLMRNNSLHSFSSSSPLIKSEEHSPIQSQHAFGNNMAQTSFQFSSSSVEPDDESALSFSTDVDTLMKAIQAKLKNGEADSPKVGTITRTSSDSRLTCR